MYMLVHNQGFPKLTQLGLPNRIQALSSSLADQPSMFTQSEIGDTNYVLRTTQLLRQGRRFITMGIKSEDEIKPILLFYGLAQVCGFFVSSICKYPLSRSHGITIDANLNVSVKSRGSFVRLLDVYSLLGLKSKYSKFLWDNAQNIFVQSTSLMQYPLTKSLADLVANFDTLLISTSSNERTATLDHATYILLFVAGHLARYRPEIWKKIVDGQDHDTSMIEFRRTMESAQTLYHKMASAVFATMRGISPRHILESDSRQMVTERTTNLPESTSL